MIYDHTLKQRELVRRWPERIAQHTTDRAIALLKKLSDEQLFMWVHYQDPHGPYTPPPQFAQLFAEPGHRPRYLRLNKSLSGRGGIPSYQQLPGSRDYHYYVAQYDAEIRYFDQHFQRLIEALRQLELYDNALIIFSSDHGEGMGRHDYYFAHGENLYNCLTHVPLVIRYGRELTGRRTDFVQHLDIVPTVLDFLGVQPDPRLRGRDLRDANAPKRQIFAKMINPEAKTESISITIDKLKLITSTPGGQQELFDLQDDPYEEKNLIKDPRYRQQAGDLAVRLNRVHEEDRLRLGELPEPAKPTAEEIEKLRSLGYVR